MASVGTGEFSTVHKFVRSGREHLFLLCIGSSHTMTMKWTDSTTFAFVQEYLKHECLFNSKCNHYRNRQARDAALIQICEVMKLSGFGPKEATSKIKSLRSTYSQEMRKINESQKSGAGTDDVYVPTLKWFTIHHEVMRDKNLKPRESQSNLNPEETAIEGIASGEECTSRETQGSSRDLQTTPGTQEQEPSTPAKKPMGNRKRNLKCLENLVNQIKTVGEMVQTPTTNTQNEFDIFGKCVAAQLNAMPLILALKAQSHIQNYITTLRLQAIAQTPNLLEYSPSSPSTTTYISTPSPPATINYSTPENNATIIIPPPTTINDPVPGTSENDTTMITPPSSMTIIDPVSTTSLFINTSNEEFMAGQLNADILELAIKSINS